MTTFNPRVARRCARGCVSQCNCRDGPNHYEDFNLWIRTRETEILSLSSSGILRSCREERNDNGIVWLYFGVSTVDKHFCSFFHLIQVKLHRISDVNDQTGRHIVILILDVKTAGVFYWKINSDSFASLKGNQYVPLIFSSWQKSFQDDHTRRRETVEHCLIDIYFWSSADCIKDDIGWGDKEPI